MTQGYAGDITSREAWDILRQDPRAVLVDVRSEPEWRYVGVPDLAGIDKRTVLVSWQHHPGMRQNPDFLAEVAAAGVEPGQTLLLLCRSGARSRSAAIALTERGYQTCYNVAGGFEGPHDGEQHRGTRDGWKAAGLPWAQD
jgi:rhodanese-related sulfurtransferase